MKCLVNQKKNIGTQGDSRMIRGNKKKPPARLTKRKLSSFMSTEKEKSQRKKIGTTSVIFPFYIYVGSNQNKSYKNLPNAMKR
jgi:hypothetical protein